MHAQELVVEEYVGFYVVVALVGLEGQHQVGFALAQQADELLAGLADEIQLDSGVVVGEVPHRFGENRAERVGDPDRQLAGNHFLQVAYLVLAVPRILQGPPGQGKEAAAVLGQRHRVRITLEQGCPEFLLQLLDLLGESALCHVQAPCRLGEVQSLGNFHEVVQLSEFHGNYIVLTN